MLRPQTYRNGIPEKEKGFIHGRTFKCAATGRFFTVRMSAIGEREKPVEFIDGKGFGGPILFKASGDYRQAVMMACENIGDLITRRKKSKAKSIRFSGW